MSRHPFTDEDIDAAFENLGMDKKGLRLAIYYLWESAVARGAVEPLYPGRMLDKGIFEKPGYFIKLPEDKP
jgi:hypothetical protein